jgi:hypothetical protein
VISTRKNGYRVIGEVVVLAHDPFTVDTQPMQGLAAKYESLLRVVSVKIDDQLRVERVGDHWVVSERDGELGWCRWRTADDGRVNAVTDMVIRLPSIGTLHVLGLVVERSARVKNLLAEAGQGVSPTAQAVAWLSFPRRRRLLRDMTSNATSAVRRVAPPAARTRPSVVPGGRNDSASRAACVPAGSLMVTNTPFTESTGTGWPSSVAV